MTKVVSTRSPCWNADVSVRVAAAVVTVRGAKAQQMLGGPAGVLQRQGGHRRRRLKSGQQSDLDAVARVRRPSRRCRIGPSRRLRCARRRPLRRASRSRTPAVRRGFCCAPEQRTSRQHSWPLALTAACGVWSAICLRNVSRRVICSSSEKHDALVRCRRVVANVQLGVWSSCATVSRPYTPRDPILDSSFDHVSLSRLGLTNASWWMCRRPGAAAARLSGEAALVGKWRG